MDSDLENIYGECRCCLARGHHRDILKEYYFNGVREVYIDIFKETFNLFLSKMQSLSVLICSRCVARLRDACSFRMMVVSTEQHLLNIHKQDGNVTVFVDVPSETRDGPTEVKCEVKVESDCENEDDENDLDFLADDDLVAEPIDSASDSPLSSLVGEAALLARWRGVSRLPTRKDLRTILPNYAKHLEMLKHVDMSSTLISSLQLTESVPRCGLSALSEKAALVSNATVLLRCSNMTPFKSKQQTGFPCFYCRHIFEDFSKLREHTQEHKTSELSRVLKRFGAESLIVYADVTDLKCLLCGDLIPNINELKTHVTKKHGKKLIPNITDRVIPFKIKKDVFVCQICTCRFETFGAMERHMNGHYRNYTCKECGNGYITKCRLKVHYKSMHVDEKHPCAECGKIFNTAQKHKNHVNTVHKMIKRFKCAKCPERFVEYFRRQKHMVETHGVAPLKYSCNVCEKSFDRKYTLSRHLKRDHLEERDYQCDVCVYTCYTKNELKVHMIKHTGERIHDCPICKKSYARKKTLKEHMRIHNNDRRFVCPACGQAFVQKCSLKGHMRTHHLEYNLP